MAFGDTLSNRIDPALLDTCHPDHRARYEFAAGFVEGRVLDAGCGFGYGSPTLLRHNGASVLGVDLYEEAIHYARAHFASERVSFEVANVTELGGTFDSIVCLEAVEHVEDDAGFVAALKGLLAPSGTLVISTPNSLVTSPGGEPADPTHVREYTPEGFQALLRDGGFGEVEIYGLHLGERVHARHQARSRLGRMDRLGVKRLIPARLKAAIISRVTPGVDTTRIDRDVASAEDQIAVAR